MSGIDINSTRDNTISIRQEDATINVHLLGLEDKLDTLEYEAKLKNEKIQELTDLIDRLCVRFNF